MVESTCGRQLDFLKAASRKYCVEQIVEALLAANGLNGCDGGGRRLAELKGD